VFLQENQVICGWLIKIRANGNVKDPWKIRNPQFPSTQALRHNEVEHDFKTDEEVRKEVTRLAIMAGTTVTHIDVELPVVQSKLLKKWVLKGVIQRFDGRWSDQKMRQLIWYVYSSQHISQSTFNEKEFHELLLSADEKFAFMDRQELESWVDAEWEFFDVAIQFINDSVDEYFYGNPSSQFFHDGITLTNGHKYTMQGLQFVWDSVNWTISIGFARCLSGKSAPVAAVCEESLKARNWSLSSIGEVIADFANDAQKVATLMGHEKKGCNMHNEMKIAESMVGKLVRSCNKTPVNPFPEGLGICKIVKDVIKLFHHGHISELHQYCTPDTGNCAMLRLNCSENATRVTGTWKEFHDTLRMFPAIEWHALKTKNQLTKLYVQHVDQICEFEALMSIVKHNTDLSQHEAVYIGAYKQFINRELESKLDVTEGTGIAVVDVKQITKSVQTPRVHRDYSDCTVEGQETWERAVEECLRRHEMQGACIDKSDMISTVLDLRLFYMPHFSPIERDQAFHATKAEYVSFGLQRAKSLSLTQSAASSMSSNLPVQPQSENTSRFVLGANPYLNQNVVTDSGIEQQGMRASLEAEFDNVIQRWKFMVIDWFDLFPDMDNAANVLLWKSVLLLPAPTDENSEEGKTLQEEQALASAQLAAAYCLHPVDDLLKLDMAPLYESLDLEGLYGLLPKMGLARIGRHLGESYCERMGSCAKQVMDDGSSLLSDELLEKIVVLRMNKNLLRYMRGKYPDLMRKAVADKIESKVSEQTRKKDARKKQTTLFQFSK
jgi:hypothetical protein